MSPLAKAFVEWNEAIYRETGEEPKRLVLPGLAFDLLRAELALDRQICLAIDDPVSGVGPDDRLWFCGIEIVKDQP